MMTRGVMVVVNHCRGRRGFYAEAGGYGAPVRESTASRHTGEFWHYAGDGFEPSLPHWVVSIDAWNR